MKHTSGNSEINVKSPRRRRSGISGGETKSKILIIVTAALAGVLLIVGILTVFNSDERADSPVADASIRSSIVDPLKEYWRSEYKRKIQDAQGSDESAPTTAPMASAETTVPQNEQGVESTTSVETLVPPEDQTVPPTTSAEMPGDQIVSPTVGAETIPAPGASNSGTLEDQHILCVDDSEIVIVGDSLAMMIEEYGHIDNATFIAFGGWTVREGVNRLQTYLSTGDIPGKGIAPGGVDPNRPLTIVIKLGSNGWGVDEGQQVFDELIQINNAEIIMIKPRFVDDSLVSLNEMIADVRSGIDRFVRRWPQYSVKVLDAEQAPLADHLYDPDGVHFTPEGYRIFSNWLAAAICTARDI